MLETQPRLSTGYLVLLSLPTAAVGFFLSAITASLSWILSTRYGLHIDNIALIWLAGPLAGLLVQPLVGFLSDRTWILGSRRKPYLLVGGLTGTASLLALLKLNDIAAYTGLSLFIVAAMVAMICDLSINVTFNPARALIADLTTAGPNRVRGYTWMQTISGILGIAAYLISISLGNYALIIMTAVLVFTLSIAPLFFITEIPPSSEKLFSTQQHKESLKNWTAFRALMPMSGFLFFGVFVAIDRLVLENALARFYIPLFSLVFVVTVVWGAALVWQDQVRPSNDTRLRKILLGHGFAWLALQSMFVMTFFFVRDFVVPATPSGTAFANSIIRLVENKEPNAADTAGNMLSLGFLLLNLVGALFPILVLEPLCQKIGKVKVHRYALGSMVFGFFLTSLGHHGELYFYAGMLLSGIGWSSLISIVFAIFSESVDSKHMGINMGIFNASLVLPALTVPGLSKLSTEFGNNHWMFLFFAACMGVSFLLWCTVSENQLQQQ